MGTVGLVCWRTVEDGLLIFSTACVVWGSDGGGRIGERELGVGLVRAVPDGQGTIMGAGWGTSHSQYHADCSRLNPGARGEHLTIQRSWLATRLLVKHVSPVHLLQRWGLQQICTLLAAKTQSVRGASRPPATMGNFLAICQMCLLFLHLVDGCACSTRLGTSTSHTANFKT